MTWNWIVFGIMLAALIAGGVGMKVADLIEQHARKAFPALVRKIRRTLKRGGTIKNDAAKSYSCKVS